ncbi:MAG TPA: ABC transporter permease, partial [Gemmatimonadaceae bacterium]|nr:ABC transporter permease [Gemmatimonadaceae bacterium]
RADGDYGMIRRGIRRVLTLPLRRRDRWEREVEDEIKLHLALRAEQLMSEGRSPGDAYTEAVRRFGPLSESRARLLDAARHREERMQRTEYLDDLRQDLRFALRSLRREKVWTAVAVLTLALGIGATTAVFSVVSRLLLHPLPYPHADRVVIIEQQPSEGNNTGISVSILAAAPVLRAWQSDAHLFDAFEPVSQNLPGKLKTVSGDAAEVSMVSVLPTFAAFAGVQPILGRMFTRSDIENGGPVVVLGEGFWRERLGSDRGVLGKRLTINDSVFTIIGVVPADLTLGATSNRIDTWMPLDLRNDKVGARVMARLRPGIATATAARELDSLFARSAGFMNGKRIPFRTVVTRPADRLSFHDSLVLLTWAVGLVLLVACANTAHLLLARASTRQREMAIRAALGAGRARLLRQLLTESALLSGAGAICGIAIGWVGLRGLIALRPARLDALKAARLDWTTLGLMAVIAIVCAITFAVIGAVQARRQSTHDSLKSGASASGARTGHGRGRDLLIVSEMALSAVLVVGATLLVRSVVNLQRTDLGFDPHGLYVLEVSLAGPQFDSDASRSQTLADLMRRVRGLPQVTAASVASVQPGSRWFSIGRLEIDGEPRPPEQTSSFIDVNAVQATFFATMGMRFRRGGSFTDTTATAHQVIVNESFARKHWADGAALGARVRIAQTDSEPWLTIIGVVSDASVSGPTAESTAPIFYTPSSGHQGEPRILVRTTADARALAPATAMLRQIGSKHPTPPASVEQMISRSIAAPRFIMLLLAVLTALALLLAGVGLFGVMTYTVAQRTREIGIRMALGATEARIARSVVARSTGLTLCGAAIGLAGAAWATKAIESQLHGVTRLDPASFIAGGLVLIGAALVASVVPTRRALSVDPMTAIRAD